MWESIMKLIRKITKRQDQTLNSKDAAKERLHLVLMQDRANVSADFLELMKQEIIDVIKKYIDVDETAIDVRLTNKDNGDGTKGAPALYANIPIVNIKDEVRQNSKTNVQDNSSKKDQEAEKIENEIEQDQDNKTEDHKSEENEQENAVESNESQEGKEEIKESEEVIHEAQDEQSKKVVTQNTEN